MDILQRRDTDGQQIHEKMLNITNHQGDVNQNHTEISPHTCDRLLSKRQQITGVGDDMEKREHLCTVDGNINWTVTMGDSVEFPL